MVGPMTLNQLGKLKGTDMVAVLFDLISSQYPEINLIPGDPTPGTAYGIPIRKVLPSGGFRAANDGVILTASEYDYQTVQNYIFDVQLSVDEAVAAAHPWGRDRFLADESASAFRGSFGTLVSQMYYGDAANSNGFNGFATFLRNANAVTTVARLGIDAGGVAGGGVELTSAFLVRVGDDGVKFAYGNNGTFLSSTEWQRAQQVGNGKARTVLTYGSSMWIGLQYTPTSVIRIGNIPVQEGASILLSDAGIARAINRFPSAYPPTHLFMNKQALHSLRLSRSLGISGVQTMVGGFTLAPIPTDSNGIPIVITDGILSNESQMTLA